MRTTTIPTQDILPPAPAPAEPAPAVPMDRASQHATEVGAAEVVSQANLSEPSAATPEAVEPEKVTLTTRLLTRGLRLSEKLTSTRGRRIALLGGIAAGAVVAVGAKYGFHWGGGGHLQEVAQTVPSSGGASSEPTAYGIRHTAASTPLTTPGLQLDDIKRGEGLNHYLERSGLTSAEERAQVLSNGDLLDTLVKEGDVTMHGTDPRLTHKGALHIGSKQALQTYHEQWTADHSPYVGVEEASPTKVPDQTPVTPNHQPEPTETVTPKADQTTPQPKQHLPRTKEKKNQDPSPALLRILGSVVVGGFASIPFINRRSRAWMKSGVQKTLGAAQKLGRKSAQIPQSGLNQPPKVVQATATRVQPGDPDKWLSDMRPAWLGEVVSDITPRYRRPIGQAEPLDGEVVTLDELLNGPDHHR